jgi:choline dehydrogenase-like flavoprotein
MTVHLMSSVPAGDDQRFPADAFGALRGLPGAHVNDASMLPGATGVNPQGTLMALALRNATRYVEARA